MSLIQLKKGSTIWYYSPTSLQRPEDVDLPHLLQKHLKQEKEQQAPQGVARAPPTTSLRRAVHTPGAPTSRVGTPDDGPCPRDGPPWQLPEDRPPLQLPEDRLPCQLPTYRYRPLVQPPGDRPPSQVPGDIQALCDASALSNARTWIKSQGAIHRNYFNFLSNFKQNCVFATKLRVCYKTA